MAHPFKSLLGPLMPSLPVDGPKRGQSSTPIGARRANGQNSALFLVAGDATAASKLPYRLRGAPGSNLLPGLLSVIAGSVDVIGFLGLRGLFTAHITGNLVVLAAHAVTGKTTPLAPILSVPVFVIALGLTRLAAGRLERMGRATLCPLLALQLVLLASFLVLGVAADPVQDPNAPLAVVAGMLGVAAMAVQNALVQISLAGAPATAVMTTDITRFMMDLGTIVIAHEPIAVARARSRAMNTWPAILGFTVGCALGAILEAELGLWSLVLPTVLGVLALVRGFGLSRPQADAPR
jgi:uncharacterized membrane protein YoaK (UPF0700 family)